MRLLNILIAIFLVVVMFSCKGKSTEKVKQKFKTELAQINAVLAMVNQCKSAEVKEYSISLKERKAFTLRLSDCDVSDMDAEASRINALLKNQLNFYCDIKVVTYEFLKGDERLEVVYKECEKAQ